VQNGITNHAAKRRRRRGATLVEFAITVPILFLFVFGSFEFSRVIMLRNTIENAACEGARRGIVPGATALACEQSAQQLLDIVGVNNSTVDATPDPLAPDSEEVTVDVTVPLDASNGYLLPKYFLGREIHATITLPRQLD
jgi:Flp pilus assembly protein TadG